MNRAAVILIAVLTSLLGLSLRSGFSVHDVDSMNWEIALMLSPWGYLNNFLLQTDHYLAPYYQVVSERSSLLVDPLFALQLIVNSALALYGLWILRQKEQSK